MNRTHTEEDNAKRRQGGRPRLPDREKRDRPVKVYFDRANYSKLVRRSRRSGRPLSEIVYELAVNGYVTAYIAEENSRLSKEISGLIVRLNEQL